MPEKTPQDGPSARGDSGYSGQVVYIHAYDVAYDMKRLPVPQLLERKPVSYSADVTKRGPKRPFFYLPQMVCLEEVEQTGPFGPVSVRHTVKLFPVGAISIAMWVPFHVDHLEDLAGFHDLRFEGGSVSQAAARIAERARRELAPFCIRPNDVLPDAEAYTVFCLEPPAGTDGPFDAEEWLSSHRREVAGVLTEEADAGRLSDQETGESTGRYLSYYGSDLSVVDWDAALVVGPPEDFEDVLHVLELANVQLAELEAYDRILDSALERSYRDLGPQRVRGARETQRRLREIRVDLARLNDELSNITKFFGDWHLARLYQAVSARFHLDDWQKVIADKLRTLDGLYQILKQDQTNRWMIVLEATIVALFILDVILLLLGLT